MNLTGKKILIISPQAWNKVRVSKHHYATTLADMGNEVYFLDPPSSTGSFFEIAATDHLNVKLVYYRPFFPVLLRFRFKTLFRFLMRHQVKQIVRKMNVKFDVVWCFDPNLYSDLSAFGAPVKIFHPVDVFGHEEALTTARSADLIFSVSPSILAAFESVGKPQFHINHGLGKAFASMAKENPVSSPTGSKRRIGYIGNLQIPYMNRSLIREVVVAKPDYEFHFIGPFAKDQSSLGEGDHQSDQFIEFLKEQKNVVLHGPMGSAELAQAMKGFDAFLICYTGNVPGYDLSNTHKMLEYLSTGKPIISTPIKAYLDHRDIIAMPVEQNEAEYPVFFISTLSNLDQLDSDSLQSRRKALALANTYEKQVQRIGDIINDLKLFQ